jgi:hypothetical protein
VARQVPNTGTWNRPVPSYMLCDMRRIAQAGGAVFLLLGIFWTGRESTHGVTAFWEHWWCPIPLVLALVGLAAVIAARRRPAPTP